MGTTKNRKTVWFGMKLSPEEKEKIRTLARLKGVSQKKAVLDLIEKELNERPVNIKPGSFLEAAGELIGSVEGPRDLSTNPKHLKGYGQ